MPAVDEIAIGRRVICRQVSDLLGKELEVYGNIKSKLEWNKLQINFLEAHQYHTDFAIRNRQPKKEERIFELKQWVENRK